VTNTTSPTERVGRYQLLEPIGIGPSGSVSRAKVFGVAGFERQFAVKRFHPELTATAAMAAMLSAAARAYGSLEHPRIARMSEFGVAQGATFTAVEYVLGLDALRLIGEARLAGVTLATGGALALVSQAARAIGYAHGRGLTHLGLAPTNVIVTADGDVKITDFGVLSATLPPRPIEAPRLAQRIPYLAPEQLANEATSAATDVFALGVLAYELVTGQRTFRGDTPQQVASAIMAGPPSEPALPRPIGRVLQRCLARSPFERFPDARALADALDAALRVAPVPGTRKDIGAQVKETLDRLAALNDSQLSGVVALHLGTGPLRRGDEPTAGDHGLEASPARPLSQGDRLVSGLTGASGATTPVADLPRPPITTMPGVAPPPIPVPPGGAAGASWSTAPPAGTSTLLGIGSATPAIPAIRPPPGSVTGLPPPIPLAALRAASRGEADVLPEEAPTPPRTSTPIDTLDPEDLVSLDPGAGEAADRDPDPIRAAERAALDPGPVAPMVLEAPGDEPSWRGPHDRITSDEDLDFESRTQAGAGALRDAARARAARDGDPGAARAARDGDPGAARAARDGDPGAARAARDGDPGAAHAAGDGDPGAAPAAGDGDPGAAPAAGDGEPLLGGRTMLGVPVPVRPPTAPPIPSGASPPVAWGAASQEPQTDELSRMLEDYRKHPVPIPAAPAPAPPVVGEPVVPSTPPPPMLPPPGPPPGWVTAPPPGRAYPSSSTQGSVAPRSRARWIAAGIVVTVAAAVGAGQLSLRTATRSDRPTAPATRPPGDAQLATAPTIAVAPPGDAASSGGDATRLTTAPRDAEQGAVTPPADAADAAGLAASPSDAPSADATGLATSPSDAPPTDATRLATSPSDAPPADAARLATSPSDATTVAVVGGDAGRGVAPGDASGASTAVRIQPNSPPAAGTSLVISSTPPGARVFLDGADTGTTPVKLPGSPDRHTIALLLAGHELYIAQVDGHGSFQIPLKEVTPSNGPAGIKVLRCKDKDRYYVFVDGKPTGQTCPTERIGCELGPHTVEVYDVVSETRRKWDIVVKDTRLSFRVRVE
jgi:eukaryotic-like serine/threonine-protein kinase